MRTPLILTASASAGEVRIYEVGPRVEETGRFLFDLDKAERAVVEDDNLNRQVQLDQAQQIARHRPTIPCWRRRLDRRPGRGRGKFPLNRVLTGNFLVLAPSKRQK